MSAFQAFYQWVQRDLLLAFRRPSDLMQPLLFFVMVIFIFPLAINPSPALLHEIAPGLIWLSALLAMLLALGQLFTRDYQAGTLEQLLLTPHLLSFMVAAKILAHWLVSALPLLILTPLLAVFLSLSWTEALTLLVSLLIGTPIFSLIGALGAALTISARASILLPLLVLPLCIPVLIFGAGSVLNVSHHLPAAPLLWLLSSILILALTLVPVATAAALRLSME